MPKTEEKQAVKAVIYARYSSDRQREESIEGQLRVCEDYANRNNMTILHTYADRAMTGRSDLSAISKTGNTKTLFAW